MICDSHSVALTLKEVIMSNCISNEPGLETVVFVVLAGLVVGDLASTIFAVAPGAGANWTP